MSVSEQTIEQLINRVKSLETRLAEMEEAQGEDWIKLEQYCKRTGETKDAVYCRRHAGKWVDGIHCDMRNGRLWINYREAMKWKNRNTSRPV